MARKRTVYVVETGPRDVYVGSTERTAKERFRTHKRCGRTAAGDVCRHGKRLRPDLSRGARSESALARKLRRRGFRVAGSAKPFRPVKGSHMAKITIAGKSPKSLLNAAMGKKPRKRRSKKSALATWNEKQKRARRAAFGARRRKPRVKAHKSLGRKFCKRCRGPHTIGAHKSHGHGSFRRTHPGRFKAKSKKRKTTTKRSRRR